MKTFAFIVVLSLVAVTVHSPANATASASAIISDVTCTQVTNIAGTLVSTPSFASEFSFVGPIGQINEGLSGLQPTAATCFASRLAQGESLTMSAHVTLTVQDQGLLGAGGGHIQFPFPYWDAFIPNPVPVPSGFEFAYAAADISNHPNPRDSSHYDEYKTAYGIQVIQTTQDGIANTVTFSGILESTIVPSGYPEPFSPATGVSMQVLVSLWAVSGVPEPETNAMLLAGLGLLGFVARRKKCKVS